MEYIVFRKIYMNDEMTMKVNFILLSQRLDRDRQEVSLILLKTPPREFETRLDIEVTLVCKNF